MSKDSALHPQWVTRYNLTIAFEELYTQDASQLHATANAIGEVASAIEQLLVTDASLQELLKAQNLKLSVIAPARLSARPDAGDSHVTD
jgi:hypothetical protein